MCASLKIVNSPAGSKRVNPRHQSAGQTEPSNIARLINGPSRKFNGPGQALKFRHMHTSSWRCVLTAGAAVW